MSVESNGTGPVVVAWTPDEFGAVALEHGLVEAADRRCGVVVVNATKGDALVDPRYASEEAVGRLRESVAGQDVEVRQSTGGHAVGHEAGVDRPVQERQVAPAPAHQHPARQVRCHG